MNARTRKNVRDAQRMLLGKDFIVHKIGQQGACEWCGTPIAFIHRAHELVLFDTGYLRECEITCRELESL